MPDPQQPDWRSAWRDIAQLSSGLEPGDPRLHPVREAIADCEAAYAMGDLPAFQHARTGVVIAMGSGV